MIRRTHTLFLLVAFVLAPQIISAQATTGTPPYGSFAGGSFDTVDLANLNIHFAIPIQQKAGRDLPFHYVMGFDSSIWVPTTVGSSTTWQPVNTNWGWTAQTEALTGSVTLYHTTASCFVTNPNSGLRTKVSYPTTTYRGYKDANGTFHTATIITTPGYANCDDGPVPPVYSGTQAAIDGSGYVLSVNEQASPSIVVQNRSGWSIPSPGSSTGTVIDTNGNELTSSVNGTTTTFTDTLGTTALTVNTSGSSQTTYTYTAPSGAQPHIAFNYTQMTVKTAFGCSGVTEYPATPVYLVASVTLPDSTSYTFAYETTPNDTHSPHYVTGRIASVTLPTGGQISYSYVGGVNGINCADGSTAGLRRTTPDGVWGYDLGGGITSVTDPTTPTGNRTIISFQGILETQRQIYQGTNLPANLLKTINTCYNGSASPCTGTAITFPITQRTVTEVLAGSGNLQCKHVYKYNSNGSMTEQDDYDYGPGAPASTPLRKALIGYTTLTNNIVDRPASMTIQDGGNHTIASTTYNYDETTPTSTSGVLQHTPITGSRGNLTSINYPVSGLTTHFTYYDTGSLNTQQDVNSATTTYNYSSNAASCQMAFPTGIAEPLGSMSKAFTWNCTGGTMTQLADENSKSVSATYTDTQFWRPASATDQVSAATNFTYTGQTALETALNFNSGNSTSDQLTTLDSLGRAHVQQTKQSPASTSYDSVETDYDALGRPSRTTLPYSATAGQTTSPTGPGVTTTYDALSRPLTITDSGGGIASYSYSNNDVLITVGPAPTGENSKKRQLEYDSLGRLTSVCEITAGTTAWPSGTCAQTASQTGYWTKYTYDTLGDLQTVTQNAQATAANQQTRTYTYDAMSRLTSEKNPEMAQNTVTYVYDTDATCTPTAKGDLVKRIDPAGNTTCFTSDALHRITSATYSGTYASNSPNKYFVYDAATVNSVAMQNTKTRLAEAYTCVSPCTAKITDAGFSYSARGEVTDVYESTPHSGTTGATYNHSSALYWPSGALNTLSGPGLPTLTFGPDGEGRIKTISASTGANPVTATTYNTASQPTAVTLGSSDSDAFQYDASTLRLTQYRFNVGAQSIVGNLGWNANGSLASLAITDPFNSADTQNCAYNADDLSRINTANCGAIWGQSFAYDPFGNILKTVLTGSAGTSFLPTYQTSPSITNRIATLPGGITPTYDANGNSLNDNFNQYTWDAENRPVSVNGAAIVLTYDALGRMVEQARGTSYSQIVYSPLGSKLAKMNGTTLQTGYVSLTNGASAIYASSGLAYYRHSDHLGSSRFASTPTQTRYSDTAYSAFGEPYAPAGSTDASFTGQDQDTTAGIYDFLYRKYDPGQSRWISPDPIGLASTDASNPQSFNRYAFVQNSPLNQFDPLGLYTVCIGGMTYDEVDFFVDGVFSGSDINFIGDKCGGGGGGANPSGAGGGGGDGSVVRGLLTKLKNAVCSAIPAGRVSGINASAGTIGGVTGGFEGVVNWNTGQASVFGNAGGFGGFNGGGSISITGGLIFNLGNSNSNYSGTFTTASGSVGPVGGFGSLTGTPTSINLSGPKVVGGSLGASMFGAGTGTVSVTKYGNPHDVGNFVQGTFPAQMTDYIMYLVRKPCN
jgi:RHS repeat-associated protein